MTRKRRPCPLQRIAIHAAAGNGLPFGEADEALEAKMKQKSRRQPSPRKRSNGRREVARLEEIPNVGPAIAADLRRLGITSPSDLLGRDPYAMYDDMCRITGQRHDPCLLDTFIAAVRFMAGEPKKPWWKYTAERKRKLAARSEASR
jgi:Pathogenicity locus